MTDKQKYDAERWKLIIAEAVSRDIKLKDWLELCGICKDAYYYWLYKLQRENFDDSLCELPAKIQQEPAFIEISKPELCSQMKEKSSAQPAAVIKANNIQIELFSNTSFDIIR